MEGGNNLPMAVEKSRASSTYQRLCWPGQVLREAAVGGRTADAPPRASSTGDGSAAKGRRALARRGHPELGEKVPVFPGLSTRSNDCGKWPSSRRRRCSAHCPACASPCFSQKGQGVRTARSREPCAQARGSTDGGLAEIIMPPCSHREAVRIAATWRRASRTVRGVAPHQKPVGPIVLGALRARPTCTRLTLRSAAWRARKALGLWLPRHPIR